MTGRALRQALRRLGMSQLGFARKLSVRPSTVHRWLTGRSPIPEAVALLLQEWLTKK